MTQISIYATSGKDVHKLDGLWASATWSGDMSKVYRTFEFTLENTANGVSKHINIEMGSLVRMVRKRDKVEFFRGYVFKKNIGTDGKQVFTCYDPAFYLTKNVAREAYRNKTASQIITSLLKKYDMPVGGVASTKHKFKKLKFRNMTLDKIINTVLTENRQKGGKKSFVECRKGKIYVKEVETLPFKYKASTKTNIISSSSSMSNEDRYTAVRLTGGKEEAKPTISSVAKDDGSIAKYGLMQFQEHRSNVTKTKKLKTLAKELLDKLDVTKQTLNVDVIGNLGFRAGRRLHVTETMAGKKGLFYIATDSHTFNANGTHTSSLTLTYNVKLPVEEYAAPSEPSKEKPKGDSAITTSTGKFTTTVATYSPGWEATAYNYRMGGINGSTSGITAVGTKVDEPRTIAVDPRVIPYGSIVALYTSNKDLRKYNGLYLAEDTGGAIKGKRIDIAMKTAAETKAWGRRKISVAIIEKGGGPADARAKAANWAKEKLRVESKLQAKANKAAIQKTSGSYATGNVAKVLEYAKSQHLDFRYLMGGKFPNAARTKRLDCSGWTKHVYLQVGVNIGDGTSNQATAGRLIQKSQIQAGDLLIFKNTYRNGVSHVGIAMDSVNFMDMGGATGTPGPRKSKLTDPYWVKHYHSARRVL